MTEAAIKYLTDKEWSMGNGQCPECHGVHAGWHGHPCHMTTDTIGHKEDCTLAAALTAMGQSPLMIGTFQSDIEFESYITEGGFYSTRHKTADGCPKWLAFESMRRKKLDEVVFCLITEAGRRVLAGIEDIYAAMPAPSQITYGPIKKCGKGKVRKFA